MRLVLCCSVVDFISVVVIVVNYSFILRSRSLL